MSQQEGPFIHLTVSYFYLFDGAVETSGWRDKNWRGRAGKEKKKYHTHYKISNSYLIYALIKIYNKICFDVIIDHPLKMFNKQMTTGVTSSLFFPQKKQAVNTALFKLIWKDKKCSKQLPINTSSKYEATLAFISIFGDLITSISIFVSF